MEDYAAKMQLKSEAALREYVTGYAQYRDEAVLAALAELRHRGQPASEEAHLRPLLEEAMRQQLATTVVPTTGNSLPETDAEASAPALYTPGVIVLFSVLFSFISGAVLLALNFRQLGRGRAIWGLAAFVTAYLVGELVLGSWLEARYGAGAFSQLVGAALNVPVLLAYLLWFWPRYIGTSAFRPRPWLAPLLICFGLAVAYSAYLMHVGQLPSLPQLQQKQP